MKAYEVYYSTGGKTTNTVVLVKEDSGIETALSEKDYEFDLDSNFSKIEFKNEIPLSNVMIKDLSVAELLMIIKDVRSELIEYKKN